MQKIWQWSAKWVPVIIMCVVIFGASTDSGSFPHSSRIIAPFVKWFWPAVPAATLHSIVVGVRKAAHLTEYGILALLFLRALGETGGWLAWNGRRAAAALGFVAIYAASDEFHQVFVPGRQGSPWDVALDIAGGCFGLGLAWAWFRFARKRSSECGYAGDLPIPAHEQTSRLRRKPSVNHTWEDA